VDMGCVRLYGPDVDQEYDLDNPEHQQKLGISKNQKHADSYCHFTNCRWLLEERKRANQIKIAIEQLESTVRQLQIHQWPVTDTIIVMEKLSRAEQHRFYVDPKTHELRNKDSAQGIRILNLKETVKLFFEKDLPRIVAEWREFKWASVSS
jgi:hypothetical protein